MLDWLASVRRRWRPNGTETYEHADGSTCWWNENEDLWIISSSGKQCGVCNHYEKNNSHLHNTIMTPEVEPTGLTKWWEKFWELLHKPLCKRDGHEWITRSGRRFCRWCGEGRD